MRHRNASLGAARSIFRWPNDLPPKTPEEALAALAESDLRCDRCRAKFANEETFNLHREHYHRMDKINPRTAGLKNL